MMTFDRFEPGAVIGTVTFDLTEARMAEWRMLFPDEPASGPTLPPGLVIAMMMRGYIHILGERPDGNVHAEQELRWFGPAPCNEPLVVGLRCLRKEVRSQRRWVWLENSVGNQAGATYLRGTMRMLWAR